MLIGLSLFELTCLMNDCARSVARICSKAAKSFVDKYFVLMWFVPARNRPIRALTQKSTHAPTCPVCFERLYLAFASHCLFAKVSLLSR